MHQTPAAPADLIRPFAILAAGAFAAGFVGFLAVAGVQMNDRRAQLAATPAPAALVSNPPSASGAASEDWNFPKKI